MVNGGSIRYPFLLLRAVEYLVDHAAASRKRWDVSSGAGFRGCISPCSGYASRNKTGEASLSPMVSGSTLG